MDGLKPRRWSWPLALLLATTGCYEWVRVPPGELPRLDESAPRPTNLPEAAPKGPVVRTESGESIEVEGEFAIKVTTEGDSVDFMSPLHCSLTGETLRLAEDGATPQSFRLQQIRSAEVYRRDRTLSVVVMALGVVAAGAALIVLGDAFVHSGSSVK